MVEKVLIRYEGNGSSRYDGKEYFEAASKLKREKNSRGPLKNGEQVTIKTKNRVIVFGSFLRRKGNRCVRSTS